MTESGVADPVTIFIMSLSRERGSSIRQELLEKPLHLYGRAGAWKVRIMEGSPQGAIGLALDPVLR